MNKVIRNSVIIIVSLCTLTVSAYYVAVNRVLPYSPIRPHRIGRDEIRRYFPDGASPDKTGLKFSPLDVTVEDSINLRGWFIYARRDSAIGTVILLHGIASCKEAMLPLAGTLASAGYNCIVYDSRAHGESGGTNCTFGYYEKRDVSVFIDSSIERFSNVQPVGIYGASLGAAIAIQAMATDRRIRCGIAESPFATMREVIYDYWKSFSGLPVHSIPDGALRNSEKIANFAVDSVSPEDYAKRIDSPVLIIHGDKDEKISIHYGERVFKNLHSPEKKFYLVPGAGHDNLAAIGGQAYSNTVLDFFRTHLRN